MYGAITVFKLEFSPQSFEVEASLEGWKSGTLERGNAGKQQKCIAIVTSVQLFGCFGLSKNSIFSCFSTSLGFPGLVGVT